LLWLGSGSALRRPLGITIRRRFTPVAALSRCRLDRPYCSGNAELGHFDQFRPTSPSVGCGSVKVSRQPLQFARPIRVKQQQNGRQNEAAVKLAEVRAGGGCPIPRSQLFVRVAAVWGKTALPPYAVPGEWFPVHGKSFSFASASSPSAGAALKGPTR
jgi:hypothetical protein